MTCFVEIEGTDSWEKFTYQSTSKCTGIWDDVIPMILREGLGARRVRSSTDEEQYQLYDWKNIKEFNTHISFHAGKDLLFQDSLWFLNVITATWCFNLRLYLLPMTITKKNLNQNIMKTEFCSPIVPAQMTMLSIPNSGPDLPSTWT